MTKGPSFSDKFKTTMAFEVLGGDKIVQDIGAMHKVHPSEVTIWKRQAIDHCLTIDARIVRGSFTDALSSKISTGESKEVKAKELHAKIGKLAVENDFFRKG